MLIEHSLALSCRKMQIDDLEQVLMIENQCHTHPWSKANFLTSLNSQHACWVLEKKREIIAYGITSTVLGEAELLNISVSLKWQRQGVAQAFLQALCDSFAEQIESFFLEVRASNTPAIALYQSLHFNEVGQRPNYYPTENGREDAIIMAKDLKSPF